MLQQRMNQIKDNQHVSITYHWECICQVYVDKKIVLTDHMFDLDEIPILGIINRSNWSFTLTILFVAWISTIVFYIQRKNSFTYEMDDLPYHCHISMLSRYICRLHNGTDFLNRFDLGKNNFLRETDLLLCSYCNWIHPNDLDNVHNHRKPIAYWCKHVYFDIEIDLFDMLVFQLKKSTSCPSKTASPWILTWTILFVTIIMTIIIYGDWKLKRIFPKRMTNLHHIYNSLEYIVHYDIENVRHTMLQLIQLVNYQYTLHYSLDRFFDHNDNHKFV